MRVKYINVLIFGLVMAFGVIGLSPSASAIVEDSDNIPTVTENASPNDGDNNYDGVADSVQDTVATTKNPNDTESPNAWVSLEISSPTVEATSQRVETGPTNWEIQEFNPIDPETLPSQPDGSKFPVGLFNVKLRCGGEIVNGQCYSYNCDNDEMYDYICFPSIQNTVNLKLIFDRVIDTSQWTTRKYDPNTDSYIDYSPYVNIYTENIGYDRTVVEWSLTDGGFGDTDGIVNGEIVDPIGPTVPAVTDSPKLATATEINGPTLANTGLGTNIALAIAATLITLSILIFPKNLLKQD